MEKNISLILIFIFFFLGKASAQLTLDFNTLSPSLEIAPSERTIEYLPLSNYHFFNSYYHNPAMAGIEDKKQLNLDWNRQIENAYLISYEQPISSINSAFGIFISSTSEYRTSIRNYGLTYNYGFKFRNDVKLKFGFQFSQTHFSLLEYVTGADPIKRWNSASSIDIGTAFQIKQLRLGISVQNLFPVKINTDYYYTEVINGRRQINISGSNTFKLSKKWDWSLAMLLRFYDNNDVYYGTPFNINDYSSYISYHKKYFFGTTIRSDRDEDKFLLWFVGLKIKEKVNLHLSFNNTSNDREDRRFFETLVQYQF